MRNKKYVTKIECVDLFCGLGGLTHGLQKEGIKVVAGVDIDPTCHYPFEKNNNSIFINADIRDLKATDIKDLYSKNSIRILAGCAPCQPFSTYNIKGRKNIQDERWELLGEFSRLITEVNPELVTMENVPQLINHVVFKEFVASLNGYFVDYKIVDCSNIGVPQTRKRLVLVASKLSPTEVKEFYVSSNPKRTVRDAISHLPAISAGGRSKLDEMHKSSRLSPINLKRIKASVPGGSWKDWDDSLKAECHKKKSGETYPSVYGRMEWDLPSPTITTQCFGYGNGRFGHPIQDRALSLREASLIQTFPVEYKFVPDGAPVSFSKLGRLIGNSVPVVLGQLIGKLLINNITSSVDFA